MDKRQALRILIDRSFFSAEAKDQILTSVDSLSDAGVDTIGEWLATQQKDLARHEDALIAELSTVLAKIDEKISQDPT